MEADRVEAGEGRDQGAQAVGISRLEGRMSGKTQHPAQGGFVGVAGLHGEPFVDHQGLGLPAFVEVGQGLLVEIAADQGQGREAAHGVGHVGGGVIVAPGQFADVGARIGGHQVEGGVAQRAASGAGGVG